MVQRLKDHLVRFWVVICQKNTAITYGLKGSRIVHSVHKTLEKQY